MKLKYTLIFLVATLPSLAAAENNGSLSVSLDSAQVVQNVQEVKIVLKKNSSVRPNKKTSWTKIKDLFL